MFIPLPRLLHLHSYPLPYPSPLPPPPPFSTRNFSPRLNPLALFISYRLLLPPSTSIFPTFTYTSHNKYHYPFQILLLNPISKENLPRGVFQRGSLQGIAQTAPSMNLPFKPSQTLPSNFPPHTLKLRWRENESRREGSVAIMGWVRWKCLRVGGEAEKTV